MHIQAENYCRFTGKLHEFKLKEAEDASWLLGRGKLFLPDPNISGIGQFITFSAWNILADRLSDIKIGTWLTLTCSYSLVKVKDKFYPNFDLDCFVTLKDQSNEQI